MRWILFINHKIIGQTVLNASRELMKIGAAELLAVLFSVSVAIKMRIRMISLTLAVAITLLLVYN